MSVAGKISFGYFITGIVYIFLSDLLMDMYHGDGGGKNPILSAGILKGWAFFLVTSVILYFILRRFLRRLHGQQHLLNAIVNNTNDWLWLIDINARVLMVNKTFIGISRRTESELIGIHPADMALTQEDRDKWRNYYSVALNGEEVHFTEEVTDSKGKSLHIEFHLFPIVNRARKVEMVACFGHDVTGLKNVQKEIEDQNNTLKEITWMQAHVIRKPVANIQGLIDALDLDHLDNNENRKLLQLIRDQSDELDLAIRQIVERASAVGDKSS